MLRKTVIAVGASLVVAAIACHGRGQAPAQPQAGPVPVAAQPRDNPRPGQPAQPAATSPAAHADGVRSIVLPTVDPNLPPGPGRENVAAACSLCHTPRYVMVQPVFSRKVWTDEVEKMRKTYGLQITDPQAAEIVNYLVAVRGTEGQGARP